MPLHHFVSLAAALGLIAAVSANDSDQKTTGNVTDTPAGTMAPSREITPATTPPRTAALAAKDAKKLVGKNVVNSSGQTIGKVKDIVVDERGAPTHAVISYEGGPSGMKTAAIPMETLASGMKGDSLVLEKSQLESAQQSQANKSPSTDKS